MTKYALISGGSGGIGTQLCLQFAERGFKVLSFAPEKFIQEVKDLKNPNIIPYALDIKNLDEIKRSVDFVKEQTEGGNLDVLYNNSGIAYGSAAIEFEDEKLHEVFDINLLGHMYMTKYHADSVIRRQGSIIFTTSISARVPLPFISLYGATKAALDQYAWYLKVELAPFGVRVHSILTGGVNTPISLNATHASFENSRYDLPGREIAKRKAGSMTADGTDPKVYAKQCVTEILKKKNVFNIYLGKGGYFVHLMSRILPVWLMEYFILSKFSVLTLFANIRRLAQKKQERIRAEEKW